MRLIVALFAVALLVSSPVRADDRKETCSRIMSAIEYRLETHKSSEDSWNDYVSKNMKHLLTPEGQAEQKQVNDALVTFIDSASKWATIYIALCK